MAAVNCCSTRLSTRTAEPVGIRATLGFPALKAWDLDRILDSSPAFPEDPIHGSSLRYGRYLCTVMHDHSFRDGTFVGFSRGPSTGLQSWGHFHHISAPEATGHFEGDGFPRRTQDGRTWVLAGDLTYQQLTPVSGLTIHPDLDVPRPASHRLVRVDHHLGLDRTPETELFYWTPAYGATSGSHTELLHRLPVAASTPMLIGDMDR